ncbi:peptidase M23 [Deinococcus piscis]|uniref:Peptidase M23 n=1 Tax=Deinococcus piscis TaxID=394230 RepID=A0ABQ3K8J4_9DEIO|nr:M23 family metallopeptidase [Deinococcus piscis]GHG00140.1 peptidase M23 [Deinococcus piscis]
MKPLPAGRWLPVLALLTAPLWALAQQGTPVPDPLQQQLEQQQEVGERQRALLAEIRGSLASLSSEEQATLNQLDRLNAEIDQLRGQSGLLDFKLRQTETRLGVTERDILALQARVGQLRSGITLHLDALYRERTGEYLALLAQAQTLPELLLRLRWANYAGERQVALIRELDRDAERLESELAAQEKTRAELKTLQAQRQQALAELAARQAESQTLLAGLRRTAAGQRLLELQGRAELAQTGQNIDTLLDAAAQQQAQLAAQRQRDLEAQRQREAETAARLRAAQDAGAGSGGQATPGPASQSLASQSAAPQSSGPQASASQSPAPQPPASQPPAPQAAAPRSAAPASPASPRPAPGRTPAAPTSAPAASSDVRIVPQAPVPLQEPAPTPQQLAEARTQAEARVQLTEAQLAPLRGRLDALTFPVEGGRVSEAYTPDSPWAVIRGGSGQVASASGEGVVLAVTSFSSLGWVVLLDHGGGLVTAYLGLDEPAVQVGERLKAGAALGKLGGSPVFGPDAMAFQVSRVEGGERTPLPPPF